MNTKILSALAGFFLAITTPPGLHAQETLLGIGWVHSAGGLMSEWSPVGTITTSRPNDGEYHVTIHAPGQFAGAGIGDFLPQATARAGAASSRALVAEISEVSTDSVTAVFYYSLLEHPADLNGPEPTNFSFQFALLRFPLNSPKVAPASRYLFAAGSIAANGTLKKAVTSDGATLEVVRVGEGDFHLTFTKTGAFAGFGLEDFYPFATAGSQSAFQDNLPVGTADSKSADHLVVTFNIADVQNPADDTAVPEDDDFHFTIYRAGDPSPATAESGLLLGMASVQGNNGLLRRGATSLPGGSLAVQRNSPGRYRVALAAPGRFVGGEMDDFAILVHLNHSSHMDRLPSVRPLSLGPDGLEFDVRINDVETDGQIVGVAEDNDFFLTIHAAVATSQPDLRIGRAPSLTTMRGNDRYNTNTVGQRIVMSTKGKRAVRVHFATENDGNTTQGVRVRGRTGKGLVRTRCFRVTGGRANVTAAFRSAGHLAEEMRPTETVRFFVRTQFSPRTSKRRSAVRLLARPESSLVPADSARAMIKRRL